MKLPISLLVLAALSQALSVPVTKRSAVKTLEAKTSVVKTTETMPTLAKNLAAWGTVSDQMDNNQTSKRELLEGNFGERTKPIVTKYELKTPPRKNVFSKELQLMMSEQTPSHEMFAGLQPQIAKISDVLSGHGPSFEEAVVRHLHSPVSVYQTVLSLPTSYEVPSPAGSQSEYSNPKADGLRNAGRDERRLQGIPRKSMMIPNDAEQANAPLPRYTVNQPRLRFDVHPQSLDSGLARQHENLPKEVFRLQEVPTQTMPSFYPFTYYDQLIPFRPPGQYYSTHGQGKLQIVPNARNYKDYPGEENLNAKGVIPKLQIDIPLHKQGYHAHPNGAISFARFTHNIHGSTQHDTAPQQSETFHQSQPAQYQSQAIPIQLPQQIPPELMLQSHEQNKATVKQKLPHPSSLQGLIQEFEKYQPLHQQQHQPGTLNALQQHLLLQEPRQSSNLQTVQWPRVPASMPLPQSLLKPEFYLKKGNQSPITTRQTPTPFSYSRQSENYDLSLGQASAQLSSLPPLKLNYSKNVKPLELNNAQIFLPTLPTSTAKVEPVSDQLISSTTIQPDVRGQENPRTQSIQEETESQSETPQPLKPEVFYPSQPTVEPASVQSTTYLPFVTKEPQSIFFQYSTPQPNSLRPYQSTSQTPYQSKPQPTYQSTSRPTPRHDVVIQRQEIQEIFFEPSPQLSYIPRHRNKLVTSSEDELFQLRAQRPHYQLFEQLLPYKQEYQDLHSPQQYIVETRESQQKPDLAKRGKLQQYLIEQHSFPIPHLQPLQQFQQQLMQSQQPELEHSHQQQQGLKQAQQQQESDQAHQQRQQEALEKAQQHQESEQAHQQQQHASEQAHQQQQHASEQVQQQTQESEQELQQQYQQNSLEPSNQIQISTLTPPQDTEKQTETVEIQQQTESQTELQQDSKLQSSTGKPDEPPKHLSEPTLQLQQPYLGPFLTPSVVPQLYARQQSIAEPYHYPLLDVPPHSDVQYFIG